MIVKILALGALGLLGYSFFRHKRIAGNAAYAEGQPQRGHTDVRDAGPSAMRDKTQREWTETDEDLDESFPASDPPGGY